METTQHVKIETADPTPLGLMGLAMVTLVACSQKLGISEGTSLIVPWAIFLGALAQLMASALDFKHNNLFGAIAFGAYGFFWLGVASTWLIKAGVLGETLQQTADGTQLAFAFLGYFVFSLIVTLAAFRLNTMLSVLMLLIDLLLLSLTMDAFAMGHIWHTIAAYSELFISIGSFYGVAAAMLNKSYGRVMVPVGKAWTK
ncbi:GPR1/FUN34/yaaH family protein [Mucinivorans hirudinis]|uniref:GPR1/FUN34/yaaH family protein n=1 Tax=Mucinivorans hirudinis TaxID=1433126 RepID=A0A060RDA4_9BACT|nr:GPR1/FUN34/yaaH family protein [Mucinivorans hirudinis]